MIKALLAIWFYFSISATFASDRTCGNVGLTEAYRSIVVQGIEVCFFYTDVEEAQVGRLSNEPRGISIYSMSQPEKPALIHELPYAGTKGKINDVFAKSIDGVRGEVLFVIHSMDRPSTWDSISDIYDVNVITNQDGNLVQDRKLSRFFDLGGDLVDSQGNPTYVYPYKDRRSVEEAIASPVFRAINSSVEIKGIIKEKTFLYEGDAEPTVQDQNNKYLTQGDQVIVIDAVAGWCKVSYGVKKEPGTMWAQCKEIDFPEEI